MLASCKKGRDSSGHSVRPNKYKGLERPELVSRVFVLGTESWGQPAPQIRWDGVWMLADSALDCAVVTERPMSRTGRTVA